MTKCCTACGQSKTLDQYTPRKLSRDGMSSQCRERRRVRRLQWGRARGQHEVHKTLTDSDCAL